MDIIRARRTVATALMALVVAGCAATASGPADGPRRRADRGGPSDVQAAAPAAGSQAAPGAQAVPGGQAAPGTPAAAPGAQAALDASGIAVAIGSLYGQLGVPPPPDSTDSTISLGADGRLTVLVIGSDYRPPYERDWTDVVLVASIDPGTKRMAMASVQRDTSNFPVHSSNRGFWGGASTTGPERVNVMYDRYKRNDLGIRAIDAAAIERFRRDVAYAIDVEIDHTAFIRFSGFVSLVDSVNGIKLDIPATIIDPYYSSAARRGIRFPASSDWRVDGNPPCPGTSVNCRSALAFARTRKGFVGGDHNNGTYRAYRHHDVMLGAIRRVVGRGEDDLTALLEVAKGNIVTTLPRTISDALYLFDLFTGATLSRDDRVVFASDYFAYRDASTPRSTFRLNVSGVRAWADQRMGPGSG